MKTFKTKRLLIAIILILLLIDAVVLGFFIVRNKPATPQKRHHSGIEEVLKKEVGFSDGQLEKFEQIRTHEFKTLKPLFGKVRKSKDNFYSLLYEKSLSDSTIQTYADSISINQKELDLHMFSYFQKVRDICTPEQIPRFDSSMKTVIMRMTGRRSRDHKTTKSNNNT